MSDKTLHVVANRDGRSAFVEVRPLPSNAFAAVPGFDPVLVWGTEAQPSLASDRSALVARPEATMPEAGATRLWLITFPPDTVFTAPTFDPAAAGREYGERLGSLAASFEPDHPGMHTTQTVDYDIVLDGELTLEVDGGETRVLRPGDVVVQHGTRHAWRNHTAKPATLIAVLIGVSR